MPKAKEKKVSFNRILALSAVFLVLIVVWMFSEKSKVDSCCGEPVFLSDFQREEVKGIFEEEEIKVPLWVFENTLKSDLNVVLGSTAEEKWIEVDLSDQKLRAWEGSNLFLETPVSTGLPWWPTPQGEFRVWAKVRATKMEGGEGKYYYYLPNVPFVMFFENSKVPGYRGYGLHGTYWHNDFGNVHSHGCINLPTPMAEKLYYWTTPVVPEGKFFARATGDNLGTRIVIHE